jgi:hypothetical protein
MAEAQAELDEATVEPRVEGLKLRFETRKLQATLSAGIVVGVATITEVLLPPKPNYTWMLWLTYASFSRRSTALFLTCRGSPLLWRIPA